MGSIDPGSYLTDFVSDMSNTGPEALVVDVAPMHSEVWEQGGLSAFRILLAVNEESFFTSTPGLFVFFFQNPELLRDSDFIDELAGLIARYDGLDIRILDIFKGELYPASDGSAFRKAVAKLRYYARIYDQNKLIERALSAMSAAGVARSHLLWITDENIAERPADLNFFGFAVELLAGARTTFSYLAYGELPNWPSINENLLKRNAEPPAGRRTVQG